MSRTKDLRTGVVLLLVRHAESVFNLEGRFCGRSDAPLSETGREQARQLATRLRAAHPRIDGVYASPLRRALETAAPIGTPTPTPGLEELDQGELEGLRFDEALATHPDFFRAWKEDPASVAVPGGESLAQAEARVRASLLALAAQQAAGARVVVVGHQMAYAALLARVHGEGLGRWRKHGLRNADWTQLLCVDGGLRPLELV